MVVRDAFTDLRSVPALPLVCARCGRVLERVAIDLEHGQVFFRESTRRLGRGRWPSVRLREGHDRDGNPQANLVYRCDSRCRRMYAIDFEAMQQACLDAVRAGHALISLDIE